MVFPAPACDRALERSPRRWALLGFLTIAMFFCYAHRQTLAIAAPFMMKDIGLNNASVGLLLSAFFLVVFACAGALWLAHRPVRHRPGVRRRVFIWMVAVTVPSIPSTIAGFIAIQLLLGIGQGVAFPASSWAVDQLVPSR